MLRLLRNLTNLIYENSCLICNKGTKDLTVCKVCEKDFKERNENSTKYLELITVYSFGYYESKLRQGIINLKNGKKDLAKYFAGILKLFWKKSNNIHQNDYLVIPVPSHKKRIKERGYCQASFIGEEFAQQLGYDFSNKFVIREKETAYMNSLENITERKKNIKNAFKVIKNNKSLNNILIIDDILTSGNTMCEIAKTIKQLYPDVNLVGLTIASGDTYT